jgi:hypothetical protein
MVFASSRMRVSLGSRQSWEQQRGQDGDDADDDQKLNQCEGLGAA